MTRNQEPETRNGRSSVPVRTWRPMVLWSAGIVLVLGLAWFVGAVVVPVWRTARVLAAHTNTMGEPWINNEEAFVQQFGGRTNLISRLELYTRMPRIIAGDRYLAAWSLGCGGEEALPAVRRALRHAGPDVRIGAVHAAAMLAYRGNDPGLLPMLLDALRDHDGGVRFEAAKLLGRLSAAAPEIGAGAELEKCLEDADFRVRNAAAVGLWRTAGKGARPLGLLLAALEGPDPAARKDASMALADLGTDVARPALERAMTDADAEVREAVRYAQSRCDDVHILTDRDEDIDRAFAGLRDPDWEVRARTALLIGKNSWLRATDEEDAVIAVQAALKDGNLHVRNCAAYALRGHKPEQLAPRGPLTIEMYCDEKSRVVEYSIGDTPFVAGEGALREVVARKVRRRGTLTVELVPFGGVADLFQREVDGAKSACEAAGAKVAELPKLLSDDKVRMFRTGGRSAELVLGAVGVRDGTIQFRLDGRLAEGKAGVLQVFRERIAQIEQEKGGPTGIYIGRRDAPELRMPENQWREFFEALKEADPYVEDGWSESGGRRRRMVPGPDGKPIPASLGVEVRIIGPGEGGNRYEIEGRTFEGEAALSTELKRRLTEFRSGKEGPGRFTLSVWLRVEVGPGVTVTEDQLTLARKTVDDSGVGVYEKAEGQK